MCSVIGGRPWPWTKMKPWRTLYAFDPRRSAILLIGGDKTVANRWYDIPVADQLYDQHIEQLQKEGLIDR